MFRSPAPNAAAELEITVNPTVVDVPEGHDTQPVLLEATIVVSAARTGQIDRLDCSGLVVQGVAGRWLPAFSSTLTTGAGRTSYSNDVTVTDLGLETGARFRPAEALELRAGVGIHVLFGMAESNNTREIHPSWPFTALTPTVFGAVQYTRSGPPAAASGFAPALNYANTRTPRSRSKGSLDVRPSPTRTSAPRSESSCLSGPHRRSVAERENEERQSEGPDIQSRLRSTWARSTARPRC
jgi:hypothetical protein